MPETPDFDQIAAYWCFTQETDDAAEADARRAELVTVLTSIWNARGAADLTKLESELSSMMGTTAAGPYVKNLNHALRTLDR